MIIPPNLWHEPLGQDTSVLSLKQAEQVAYPARLIYKEGGHANGATEGTAGTDG